MKGILEEVIAKSHKDSSKRCNCSSDLSDFSRTFPIVREVRELFIDVQKRLESCKRIIFG